VKIRLLTLGRFSVLSGGDEQLALASQPVRASLLVFLAIEREATRDAAAAILWPEQEQSRGRHALRQTLYELRRDLGDDWLVSEGELLRVTSELEVDAVDFEATVEAGEHERALQLYRGAFLEAHHLAGTNAFQRWTDQVRDRLSRLHRRACRERIDVLIGEGEISAALEVARGWTDLDPYEDEAQHRLVELLASAGEAQEALRQYETYARLLAVEDLEPLDITKQLVARIRGGDAIDVRGVEGDAEASAAMETERPLQKPLTPVQDAAPAPGVETDRDAPSARSRGSGLPGGSAATGVWKRVAAAAVSVAGAVAIATLILDELGGGPDTDLRPERVVVLPFENQTGDPELDVVGQMAADWITQGLSRIDRLEVAPSVTVLQTVRAVATAVGGSSLAAAVTERTQAGTLITGRYYRRGDELEFFAQVTDAGDGELWQALDPVRAPLDRPGVAIDVVRQRLMGALAARFNPDAVLGSLESPAIIHAPTYEAYQAYLTGLNLYLSEGFRAAIPHWRRATDLDTAFVRARLLVAAALFNTGAYDEGDSVIASVAAQRGRLMPLEQANLAYWEAWQRHDWDGQRQALERAARLYPGSSADYVRASVAMRTGYPGRALEIIESVGPQPVWAPEESGGWALVTAALHLLGEHHRELQRAREARAVHPGLATLFLELRAAAALRRTGAVLGGVESAEGIGVEGGWTEGELALQTAAELWAHGELEASRQLAARAAAWYEARPAAERDTRAERVRLTRALLLSNRLVEADSLLSRLHGEYPDDLDYLGLAGLVAARRGAVARADSIAAELAAIQRPYLFGAPSYWRAAITAHLGRERDAIRLLRQAFDEGRAMGIRVHADPNLAPLWDLPGFQTLVAR
jgi:DNA-binding SARP family transcriptional activator/TolB-like protein